MIPYYSWTTIPLGPLTLQVWGLFVALGVLLSLWIIKKRSVHNKMSVELLYDIALWMLVGGFVGARLVHIVAYEPSYFLAQPLEMFKIWHGGLSSFGGFFGAGIGFWLYTKKKKVSSEQLYRITNELGFAAVFGWMVGRVGCAMIHDHWGVPCSCPFAIATPSGGRLDMAVLEIIALIPLASWLFVKRHSQKYTPRFLPIILIYYGLLRFVLDFFRATDLGGSDVRYFGLTPGQYSAIVVFGLGVWLLRKK
jgi:phosphatidylglycerol---prolipoprotein diacylglyceryl transferase